MIIITEGADKRIWTDRITGKKKTRKAKYETPKQTIARKKNEEKLRRIEMGDLSVIERKTPHMKKVERDNKLRMEREKQRIKDERREKLLEIKKRKLKERKTKMEAKRERTKYGLINGTLYPERTPGHIQWCNTSAKHGFYLCRSCNQRIFHIIDQANETENEIIFTNFAGRIKFDTEDIWERGLHPTL